MSEAIGQWPSLTESVHPDGAFDSIRYRCGNAYKLRTTMKSRTVLKF